MADELTAEEATGRAATDTRCPACLGTGRPLRLVADGCYRLVRCRRCRTEYFRPDPGLSGSGLPAPVSEYWEQYKLDVYADDAVQHDYEARYRSTIEAAESAVGRLESVLDVGCGIGNFVQYAQDRSIRAVGVDVDATAVRAAQDRGLAVRSSDELDAWLADGSVDAVTLWDVIEHLYDPEPVLRAALRKLRPGGAVLLETPDARFPLRRAVLAVHAASRGRADLTGPLYYWEHKIYFSQAGLRSLLARVGCEVVHVRHETSPRAKMQELFSRHSAGSPLHRVLARLWPVLETAARRARRGNKLILVARRRDAA